MYKNQWFLYDADADIASPAAAMAKQGVFVEPGTVKTETQAPPEATTAPPANTAEPAKPVADAKAEPQTPVTQAASIADKSWQEVLKSQQPEAIFKELGLDDKAVNIAKLVKDNPQMAAFFDTWQSKGNVKDFLEALSVDYSKMEPSDVMRYSLRNQFPDMSPEDFNDLFDVKITERYKQDPERFTADEVRRGKIELSADSKAIKDSLTTAQKERLLPPSPAAQTDPRITQFEARQAQQVKAVDDYKKSLFDSPYIKGIVADKKITIGEGAEAFNYTVPEPEKTLSYLYDSNALANTMVDEKGNQDYQKQALLSAFNSDPYGFLKQMGIHFKSLGAQAFVAPIENASKPGGQAAQAEAQPTNAAEAMAKNGVLKAR